MAIDQSKYPKTTNYDLFTYDGNSYANFVETLTPNFNKIDDQMKKNEDAASSKNQQIDEISTTVEQINQELPQIRENAEHASTDAAAALTSATAASNLAQTANTAANSAASSVGTVATDLAELTSTVNTNTTNIQTNARNIQEFEESINTVNENYTNVNGKLTTTIANVQKLKTGFDNYLIQDGLKKIVTFSISEDRGSMYNIKCVIPSDVPHGMIGFTATSDIGSITSPSTQCEYIKSFSYDSQMAGSSVTLSIYRPGSSVYLVLNYLGMYTPNMNGINIKLKKSDWDAVANSSLTNVVFGNTEIFACKIPSVQITNPS